METQDEPKVEGGVTPTPETTETPQTFTKDDVEKARRDARSAALAEIGRAKKEVTSAQEREKALLARMDNFIKEQENAELAAAKGDPEQLSAVEERIKRRRTESELDKVKMELTSKEAKLQEIESERETIKLEQTVKDIAVKFNVSPDRLSSLAKRFKEVTPEAIEDLAQDLPKIQTPTTIKTDSNTSTGGGGGKLTPEKVAKMSPDERFARRKEISEMQLNIS